MYCGGPEYYYSNQLEKFTLTSNSHMLRSQSITIFDKIHISELNTTNGWLQAMLNAVINAGTRIEHKSMRAI